MISGGTCCGSTSTKCTREATTITTPTDERSDPAAFRDALAGWASTVTVVAVRDPDDGKVRATTVTSFAPVSADPAEVVVSLSANALVLPFVMEGTALGITLLTEDQRRWARVFADSFAPGPLPWGDEGVPLIAGGVAGLACRVRAVHSTEGGSRLVLARVERIEPGEGGRPLLYWGREYHTLAPQ